MTANAIADLLHARRAGPGKWQAKCPAHDDRIASLSIAEGEDRRVLLKCHAGCTVEEIVERVGLTMADLFPPKDHITPRREQKAQTVLYEYTDADGKLLYRVGRTSGKRFWQERPDGNGRWIQNRDGVKPVLYNLPAVLMADLVFIAEGEKDCQTLSALRLERYKDFEGRTVATTTNSGGAGHWNAADGELFSGKEVLVFEDNDDAGRAHAQAILGSVHPHAASVKLILLPGLQAKGDVSDWMQDHTVDDLLAQIDRAPLWHPEPVATVVTANAESGSPSLSENTEKKLDILTAAFETVEDNLSHREGFHALCVALQRLRGNEPVVLPVERIAAGLGCHWTLIARLRRRAVTEGWLKPERPAVAHRQAARFFVLSDTPPTQENEKESVKQFFPQPRNHSLSHSNSSDTPQSEPLVRHLSDTPATGGVTGGYVEGEL